MWVEIAAYGHVARAVLRMKRFFLLRAVAFLGSCTTARPWARREAGGTVWELRSFQAPLHATTVQI